MYKMFRWFRAEFHLKISWIKFVLRNFLICYKEMLSSSTNGKPKKHKEHKKERKKAVFGIPIQPPTIPIVVRKVVQYFDFNGWFYMKKICSLEINDCIRI